MRARSSAGQARVTIALAETIWIGVGLYLAVGLVIGVLYALYAARLIDHAAAGAGLGFKLMIIPGVAALWPFMILRLLTGRRINTPIPGRDDEANP